MVECLYVAQYVLCSNQGVLLLSSHKKLTFILNIYNLYWLKHYIYIIIYSQDSLIG